VLRTTGARVPALSASHFLRATFGAAARPPGARQQARVAARPKRDEEA